MVTGDRGAFASRTFGQNDGGNENGKCEAEHADRLVRDSFQFVSRDFFIPQINADRYEAKQVLCVNRSTNPDPRDVWIGGKAFVEFHDGQKPSAAIRFHSLASRTRIYTAYTLHPFMRGNIAMVGHLPGQIRFPPTSMTSTTLVAPIWLKLVFRSPPIMATGNIMLSTTLRFDAV